TVSLNAEQYYRTVCDSFREHGDPMVAQFQMAYMRNQFDYFGLKMPAWMALTRQLHHLHGLPQGDELTRLVRLCFADDHREIQYFAIETCQKALPKLPAEAIDLLEEMILTQSWWDTVDWLSKLVGLHFRRYPMLIEPTVARWMDSGEMWLQRVCLLFQLLYRDKTDAGLLFGLVRRVSGSKAFFLQKGAGWALREYSKTDAAAVRAFVEQEILPPLTRREALKWLKKREASGQK
ncbi:MAG TPA: DNA alkylation repair protein, partial [Saprospiraceae bacterium]|nr:DNA alkylation repair protein [Saprospiraceae bacterium]